MANSKTDENGRKAIICASKLDGSTIVPIQADPNTHGLLSSAVTTGTDNGNNNGNAMLDENSTPVWIALSSDGSGNIIEVYGDISNGHVLVKMI